MTTTNRMERRRIPRFLCSDKFSNCQLDVTFGNDTRQFKAQSINFNHQGIALFSTHPLPEIDQCLISFSYDQGDQQVTIKKMPCVFRHINEMEIGCQYGVEFDLPPNSPFLPPLKDIESRLQHETKNNYRYGLYS